MALVEVDNLWVKYGKLAAVKGVSFEIPKGEVFGFIGPNGAGKSSTIKVLATLMAPSAGAARLDGMDIASNPHAVRRRIGYVPDFFGVYDDLEVVEYLHFFAAAFHIDRSRRNKVVDDVLQLTDLTDKQKAQVNSLSRGMKQRLSMARVLLHDPELLLLDEPASGLDPRARIEMRELLKELRNMGKTILISSHILSELAHLCTHMGIIEAGELVAVGSVEEIFQKLSVMRVVHVQLATERSSEQPLPDGASTKDESLAEHAVVMAEERAIERIGSIPGVVSVKKEPDRLAISIREQELPVEALLRAIVDADVSIRMFQPEAIDMETAFMKLTQGKLA